MIFHRKLTHYKYNFFCACCAVSPVRAGIYFVAIKYKRLSERQRSLVTSNLLTQNNLSNSHLSEPNSKYYKLTVFHTKLFRVTTFMNKQSSKCSAQKQQLVYKHNADRTRRSFLLHFCTHSLALQSIILQKCMNRPLTLTWLLWCIDKWLIAQSAHTVLLKRQIVHYSTVKW